MAAKEVMVKLPTAVYGVGGRYANAVYMAAYKVASLPAVESDLSEFKKALDTSPQLKRFVLDPTISRQKKGEAMAKAFQTSNEVTKNFIGLLAKNGRLLEIDNVLKSFSSLMQAHRKEVTAIVTTADALEPEEMQSIDVALKNFVQADEKIMMQTVVDPSILGGLTVRVGDKYVDLSIMTRIKDIKRVLDEPLE